MAISHPLRSQVRSRQQLANAEITHYHHLCALYRRRSSSYLLLSLSPTPKHVDMRITNSRPRNNHPVWMECHRAHASSTTDEPTRDGLKLAQFLARRVVDLDLSALRADGEHRGMFVDGEDSQAGGCRDRSDAFIPSNVPQLDLAVPTSRHELALSSTLEMNIRHPCLVLFPNMHKRRLGLLALVVQPKSTVTKPGDEKVSLDLIRCQRGNW